MARMSRTPRSTAGKTARKNVTRKKIARTSSARRTNDIAAALAAFAHEVRTPLTGILAVADLLATSDIGTRERHWIDSIKASADHLASLATLFVDASRRRGAKLTLRQDFFDLRALAQTTGLSLAGRAAAKGLQCDTAVARDVPGFVTGDPVRLRAALENLIDNAVKFTDAGHVTLRVSRVRGTGRSNAKSPVTVAFTVSDSGIGLALGEIRKLFKPFAQANAGIAARFGGAGLGLHAVRQMAKAMGGDVTVTARPGGGAAFTLTVRVVPARPVAARMAGRKGSKVPAGQPLKLLSVEDNPFGRVVLNAILSELGHATTFIGRGEAAPEKLLAGRYDAVLMDMVLPGIDGVATIRAIRALKTPHGRVPIIGVSGRDDDEAAARRAGADAFLLKPVSPRALATALLEASRRAAGDA